jgi:hypothetical protein
MRYGKRKLRYRYRVANWASLRTVTVAAYSSQEARELAVARLNASEAKQGREAPTVWELVPFGGGRPGVVG